MLRTIVIGRTALEVSNISNQKNNRIRTEWRINCNYPGPDEFCSLKCENEYDYR